LTDHLLAAGDRADARLLYVKFYFDVTDGLGCPVKSNLEELKLLCQFLDFFFILRL